MPPGTVIAVLTLETLFPTAPVKVPTTAMIRERTAPASGERQRVGGVSVTATCRANWCVDGLHDHRSGHTLVPDGLTTAEKMYDDDRYSLERAIAIADVSDRWVSIYLGETEFSGGAHANNALECATYVRSTGARAALSDLVGEVGARARLRAAAQALTASHANGDTPAMELDPQSFRVDATGRVVMCASDGHGSIAEL